MVWQLIPPWDGKLLSFDDPVYSERFGKCAEYVDFRITSFSGGDATIHCWRDGHDSFRSFLAGTTKCIGDLRWQSSAGHRDSRMMPQAWMRVTTTGPIA